MMVQEFGFLTLLKIPIKIHRLLGQIGPELGCAQFQRVQLLIVDIPLFVDRFVN